MINTSLEISSKTCALSFKDEKECTIIEGDKELNIAMSLQDFINYNCEYYGSSFEGRVKGAQLALGMKYKLPIIIDLIPALSQVLIIAPKLCGSSR